MVSSKLIIKKIFAPELFLLIQGFLFLLILSIAAGYSIFNLKREFCVYSISIAIVICFLYAVCSWGVLTGRLFDPYVLFLVATILFTGGQAILEIFSIKPMAIFDVYGKFQIKTVLSALFLIALGLLSFQSGGMLAALQYMGKKGLAHSRSFGNPYRMGFALRVVGWLLLLLSFFPAISQLRITINAILSGGYGAFFQIDRGTGLEGSGRVLSLFLVPGILFLLAGSKGKPFSLFISALLILLYVSMQFFIGSRMLAAMPLLAYAWLWHRAIRPLPHMMLIIGGIILMFVVFPVISVYRTTAGNMRIATPSLLLHAFNSIENPIVEILSQMASTIYTIAWTLEFVPSSRSFGLGSSYYYSLFSLVPNLFWKVHPTFANELSRWLSWKVSPSYAALGGGWGYSFVAEAYLNFGWMGMPIILILMGYFFARFVLWASNSDNPAKMALLASFSSFFFLFARGEFASIPRYLVWYSLLPYATVILIAKVKAGSVRIRRKML